MFSSLQYTKRKSPRAPIEAKAEVASGTGRIPARVCQISTGGLMLQTPEKLPPKNIVVGFDLPGFGPQRATGDICWQNQTGYGVKFNNPAVQLQQDIAAYLAKSKKLYTDLQLALAMNKPLLSIAPQLREAGLNGITDRAVLKERIGKAVELLHSPNK